MLFLDTSAILKRYVDEDGTSTVIAAMAGDPVWVASALTRAETEVAIGRLPATSEETAIRRRRFGEDWGHFRVVPVDAECLRLATFIATERPVPILAAIHVAAAERLPRPFRFLTFDPRRAAAARAMGYDVRGVDR